jgi:PTH1 family peptidyl-tRNA hydrolase
MAGDYFFFNNSKDTYTIVFKSQTKINLSGNPLKMAIKICDINSFDDIIIIHDDLELNFGKIKIKKGGTARGHNGVKNII